MKLFRGFSFLVFVVWVSCCKAQLLNFETLTTANGLSSNDITCVYEDNRGFLWVGTKDGLNKFDGRIFKIFRNNSADTNSISGNYIDDIIQDKQGIFWIATKDGGLTRLDENAPAGKQLRQFRNNPKDSLSIATNRLICLYDWDDNYLLIGAETGPAIFLNKKNYRFSYWSITQPKMLPATGAAIPYSSNWIQCIQPFGDSILYFSTLTNCALFKANKYTGDTYNIHVWGDDMLSIKQFIISKHKIWLAAWKPGLFVMPDSVLGYARKFSAIDDLLMCLYDYDNEHLLAGSRASGLFLVNKLNGSAQVFNKNVFHKHSLPSNKISCIVRDSRGIFWIGTSDGLAIYNPQTWHFEEKEFAGPELDCTNFTSYRFDDGSVAINTSNGMFLSDSQQQKFRKIVFRSQGNAIDPDYLCHEAGQDYLLGTEIGFYRWRKNSTVLDELPASHKIGHSWSKEFENFGVYQVKQIILDTIQGMPCLVMPVLGYGLGIYHLSNGLLDNYLHDAAFPATSLASNITRQVAKDMAGNIWIASAGGLSEWPTGNKSGRNNFVNYVNEVGNKNSLPVNDLNDVWCDENNHVWVSMSGGGLGELDGKNFRQYLPENSISSRIFLGLYGDRHKHIWCITRNGIEVFDRNSKKFYHLDVNDGSANSYLDPYFSNLSQGRISFTSANHIFTFNPDSFQFSLQFPEPYLADMNVLGRSYQFEALHGTVELNPKQRFVNFTASALQFTSPASVRFQYRLKGLEDSWNNSDNGEIKYAYLPWGHYTLLVKVSNPSGQFGPEKVLAQFTIATPFYAAWWFIVLFILATGGMIYLAYLYRINQILALQQVRNKIARDLHDDIGSALGGISFLSEAAKQQLQQSDTAGAEKMLAKIGNNSRETVENISDIVWSVNPKNDSAKFLIERMRVFATDLVAASGIKVQFFNEPDVEQLKLSMEERKNIFLIFKEAVYNSVKYANCESITIDIRKTITGLQLVIRDDGIGFDVKNYTSKGGNGIPNMRTRAVEIKCDFSIESSPKGTVITLKI